MIFVSWPEHYQGWMDGRHEQNFQQAWFLLEGMRKRFENVEFIPWGEMTDIPEGSTLICHPSWPIGGPGRELQNTVLGRGGQIILIHNDPLYAYTCTHGMYDRHGYKGFNNKLLHYTAPEKNGYAKVMQWEMKRAKAVICHTSPLVLDKWVNNHPDTAAWKEYTKEVNFIPSISPIDLDSFKREVFEPRENLLVYSGRCDRKRQQDIKALFPGRYTEMHGVKWKYPETYSHVINHCGIAVTASLQEAWPYWGTEAMAKGLLLVGGEDWYDGFGHEELIWRQAQDGSTKTENVAKINFLLGGGSAVRDLYEIAMDRFIAISSGSWDRWCDLIAEEIRK